MSRYRSNRLPAASGHAVGIEEAVNDFLLHHQRKSAQYNFRIPSARTGSVRTSSA